MNKTLALTLFISFSILFIFSSLYLYSPQNTITGFGITSSSPPQLGIAPGNIHSGASLPSSPTPLDAGVQSSLRRLGVPPSSAASLAHTPRRGVSHNVQEITGLLPTIQDLYTRTGNCFLLGVTSPSSSNPCAPYGSQYTYLKINGLSITTASGTTTSDLHLCCSTIPAPSGTPDSTPPSFSDSTPTPGSSTPTPITLQYFTPPAGILIPTLISPGQPCALGQNCWDNTPCPLSTHTCPNPTFFGGLLPGDSCAKAEHCADGQACHVSAVKKTFDTFGLGGLLGTSGTCPDPITLLIRASFPSDTALIGEDSSYGINTCDYAEYQSDQNTAATGNFILTSRYVSGFPVILIGSKTYNSRISLSCSQAFAQNLVKRAWVQSNDNHMHMILRMRCSSTSQGIANGETDVERDCGSVIQDHSIQNGNPCTADIQCLRDSTCASSTGLCRPSGIPSSQTPPPSTPPPSSTTSQPWAKICDDLALRGRCININDNTFDLGYFNTHAKSILVKSGLIGIICHQEGDSIKDCKPYLPGAISNNVVKYPTGISSLEFESIPKGSGIKLCDTTLYLGSCKEFTPESAPQILVDSGHELYPYVGDDWNDRAASILLGDDYYNIVDGAYLPTHGSIVTLCPNSYDDHFNWDDCAEYDSSEFLGTNLNIHQFSNLGSDHKVSSIYFGPIPSH